MTTTSKLSNSTKKLIDKLLSESTKDPYFNLPNITVSVANSNSILYHGYSGFSYLPPAPTILSSVELEALPEENRIKEDSTYDIYSCTKLVTCIAVLQLVERGKLTLEDDARQYVKELNDIKVFVKMGEDGKPILEKNTAEIKVLNLVNHTLGTLLPAVDGNPAGSVYLQNATRETLTSRPLQYTPGTHWCYGFSNDWLSLLIEDVSGLSLEDYFQQNIFIPLGITDMSFKPSSLHPLIIPGKFPKPGKGHTFAPLPPFSQKQYFGGAGLRGSALSYLKIIQTIMRGGIPIENKNGENWRLLKQDSIDRMFKSSLEKESMKPEIRQFLEKASTDLNDTVVGTKLDWGIGGALSLEDLPSGRKSGSLTWSGYLNTYWVIDRKSDLCFVIWNNTLPWGTKAIYDLWSKVEPEIYKGLIVEKI